MIAVQKNLTLKQGRYATYLNMVISSGPKLSLKSCCHNGINHEGPKTPPSWMANLSMTLQGFLHYCL